jgi:hypothetical protein
MINELIQKVGWAPPENSVEMCDGWPVVVEGLDAYDDDQACEWVMEAVSVMIMHS